MFAQTRASAILLLFSMSLLLSFFLFFSEAKFLFPVQHTISPLFPSPLCCNLISPSFSRQLFTRKQKFYFLPIRYLLGVSDFNKVRLLW